MTAQTDAAFVADCRADADDAHKALNRLTRALLVDGVSAEVYERIAAEEVGNLGCAAKMLPKALDRITALALRCERLALAEAAAKDRCGRLELALMELEEEDEIGLWPRVTPTDSRMGSGELYSPEQMPMLWDWLNRHNARFEPVDDSVPHGMIQHSLCPHCNRHHAGWGDTWEMAGLAAQAAIDACPLRNAPAADAASEASR